MTTLEPMIFVDGRRDAEVPALDRGLAYGDGLFETMRLERGRLPFRRFHLARLLAGCERLQIPFDEQLLQAQLDLAIGEASPVFAGKAVVKLTLTRGSGGRGYQPGFDHKPTVLIAVFPFPADVDEAARGVPVYLCRHALPENPALGGIKHLNRLDNVLAAMEWRGSDCRDGLLFNTAGHLVEAGSRNVFVVRGDTVLTPSLQNVGVVGILRERIIHDYAAKLGRRVRESVLVADDLRSAEEIFLTNSVTGVWPVTRLIAHDGEWLTLPRLELGRQLHAIFEEDIRERTGS